MTRHEKLIAETILGEIQGLTPTEAAEHLCTQGFLNRRTCEQRAMRSEVNRLTREGMPKSEAMYTMADIFCCSYEKVRGLYYNDYKS